MYLTSFSSRYILKSEYLTRSIGYLILKENPTFGIITALPKEFAAVEVLLENIKDVQGADQRRRRLYKLGEIPFSKGGKHTVILALLDHMGTNMASIAASYLLNDFPSI